ncbi:MAG TPA: type II toxin-antitoxin system RelE/ParE family toxin [Longimicrobium sp.]|jgi:plasmid stabilization system protein ParE|uniref:type II toxin-antitoxin system RelE/ParE family toxin n=1 Tax=Longimicrobium sp. TaxID=2029185 RepID=UPI002EDAB785
MRVRFAVAAQHDVAEARLFYSRVVPRRRAGFNAALRASVALLREYPLAGELVDAPIRRHVLTGYPFTLLYVIRREEVIIEALVHHSRDPQDWSGFLNRDP